MRTAAEESVVENYETSYPSYGSARAMMNTEGGVLAQLHTFDTYFGFKLSHLVFFFATEQVSCFLQTKNVSIYKRHFVRPS